MFNNFLIQEIQNKSDFDLIIEILKNKDIEPADGFNRHYSTFLDGVYVSDFKYYQYESDYYFDEDGEFDNYQFEDDFGDYTIMTAKEFILKYKKIDLKEWFINR
jgi:hypothetical protein